MQVKSKWTKILGMEGLWHGAAGLHTCKDRYHKGWKTKAQKYHIYKDKFEGARNDDGDEVSKLAYCEDTKIVIIQVPPGKLRR